MTLFDWLVVTIVFGMLVGIYLWVGNKVLDAVEVFWENW